MGQQLWETDESIGWMCCHEGVLSWHADEGIRWRPDLIVGYMAKEAMLQTLYDW